MMLEVFTQWNFVADSIRLNLNFVHKNNNWTFFASSYNADVISRYWLKSAFFKGGGHFKRKFQVEVTSPTNLCWYKKTRVIALSCGMKISAVCSFFRHKASTRVSDRRMDRITITKTTLAQLHYAVKGWHIFETLCRISIWNNISVTLLLIWWNTYLPWSWMTCWNLITLQQIRIHRHVPLFSYPFNNLNKIMTNAISQFYCLIILLVYCR